MCSIELAGLGVMALGTLTSAQGAKQEAAAAKDAAEYNAQVYGNLAADARTRGTQEVVRTRMATKALKGSQIAALAANGIAVNEGTALDILAGTDILSAMDQQTLMQNAEREAYGYETQANMYSATADNISPSQAGLTALLGGAARVASSWYALSKVGAGPTTTTTAKGTGFTGRGVQDMFPKTLKA